MALLLAAWPLAAGAPAFAQETALDVTFQVLDDVSAIEGVLMPLEEEPAHPADTETDSTPPPARSPTAEPVDEVVR